MIGGIFTSFLLELVVYPAIYEVWKSRGKWGGAALPFGEPEAPALASPLER